MFGVYAGTSMLLEGWTKGRELCQVKERQGVKLSALIPSLTTWRWRMFLRLEGENSLGTYPMVRQGVAWIDSWFHKNGGTVGLIVHSIFWIWTFRITIL